MNNMTVSELASIAGRTITKRKSDAARANGALGGRPKKKKNKKVLGRSEFSIYEKAEIINKKIVPNIVVRQSGCIECNTYKSGYGYAIVSSRGTLFTASRLVGEVFLSGRNLDASEFVCHKCDNRVCVNPDHLFIGSNMDNVRDCQAKGRTKYDSTKGESHRSARFTEKEVIEIRASNKSIRQLAREIGCARSTISDIVNRKHWKHI